MDTTISAAVVWLEDERCERHPVSDVVARYTVRVRSLLSVDSVGVTVGKTSAPLEIVGSDDRALRLGRVQSILDDGPCVVAAETGRPIEISDLRDERRFGSYVALALASGITAVTTIPLRHLGAHLGTIDLYRSVRGKLAEAALQDARLLADGLAAYLAPERTSEDPVEREPVGVLGIPDPDELLGDIQHAFADGSISLHYQPMIDMATSEVLGVEALVRWRHPALGAVEPRRLLRLVARSSDPLGVARGVLARVAVDARRWADRGVVDRSITVNVALSEFEHPAFVPMVLEVLGAADIAPWPLALDLPESVVLGADARRLAEVSSGLVRRGVRLWLDDVGAWYSSLEHLDATVVEAVKIGPEFVSGIAEDPESRALVTAIIELAHARGLRAHAVGVETEAQRAVLASLGCDSFQGNLVLAPVPVEVLEDFLRARGTTVRPMSSHRDQGSFPAPVGRRPGSGPRDR